MIVFGVTMNQSTELANFRAGEFDALFDLRELGLQVEGISFGSSVNEVVRVS